MNRIGLFSCCLILLVGSAASAQNEYPTPVAKIELNDGETWVFLGDSITHQCLYTQYIEDFFYTRYPKSRVHFHNSGVGGDRNIDALIRFEEDVAKFKPKYVTVLLGMNDGGYQPFDQKTFDTYEADMIKLVDKIMEIGATPILMTPTMHDARAARIANRGNEKANVYYNAVLAYFGARLREMAMSQGLGFVDMYSPLNSITMQQRKTDAQFTLIADAVHPGPDGQVVMATAILEDMHPNRTVSSVHVAIGKSGYPKATANGGKVIGVEHDSQTTAFTFQAESLPWVLPAEAALGYKLTRAGHRFSREQLRVTGLEPGRYQIKIDGAVIGTYADTQLSRGVELQSNAKTPQYQQALEVANLNKTRNDEAYRPIRNLWRDKKMQRILTDRAKANPDDAKLAEQLAAINTRLETFDNQLDTLLAKAKEFEDKIYEVNQPKEHRYEISLAKQGEAKGKAAKKKNAKAKAKAAASE